MLGRALCVALVGKSDNPLYVRTFSPPAGAMRSSGAASGGGTSGGGSPQDLRFMYMVHTSLDIVEERVTSGAKASEMYLGLLYSLEDIRVYGYVTNTKIKFVVIVQGGTAGEGPLKDSEMRQLFVRLHTEYTNLLCNPFHDVGATKLVSPAFDRTVDALLVGAGL
eukprot:Unigene13883_Nuclearia_a/m.41955 Unigene13883_Nuclearia_a/g.41955  ORF Unigene13883_Nuclearia_a/g.41955 Unigene13883_Nuclearia_a/m.41955 type:complete len:165 (-) Unigene13883_Nuclearia_a:34-528(-)